MQTIDELLGNVPAFTSLPRQHRELIAGCGQNKVFEPGDYLMREGAPADTFYVIRSGDVAIETYVPQRGQVAIETLHDGDLLGWSWLFPPYRTAFDARAIELTHTIAFDGACLREKTEVDPELGFALMKPFMAVIVDRLQSTRIRLLDVYGTTPRT
jgi:CRP/FNR family transcriptional regulator, cyclic AMP receptor protein